MTLKQRSLSHVVMGVVVALQAACLPWRVRETPTIHGTVVSAADGAPVAGARLGYADFPEAVTTTTSDGSFALAAVRKWEVVVIGTDHQPARGLDITAPGYEPAHVAIYLGGPSTYTIRLKPGLQHPKGAT